MKRNRSKTKLLTMLILTAMVVTNVSAQYQRDSEDTLPAHRQEEVYHESGLRRFEIVTFISLPFTAIHSFLGVRGVQMIRQNQFAPELSGKDFKIIGASAVSLALFIGFWDWLHTHDKDRSEQLMPTSPQRIPNSPQSPSREVGQNDWEPDEPDGLVIPLVHFRF